MRGLGPKDLEKKMKREMLIFQLLGELTQKIGPDGSFILELSSLCHRD